MRNLSFFSQYQKSPKTMIFGYTNAEFNELKAETIYVDNDTKRLNYQKLLSEIKPNDIVVIDSLLSLGDTVNSIIEEWKKITIDLKAKIIVEDIKELNDTVNDVTVSDIVIQVLEKIVKGTKIKAKQKQLEGMNKARENGIKLGRPFSKLPDNTNDILDAYIRKKINNYKAASMLGVSKATFFRMAKERRMELGDKHE